MTDQKDADGLCYFCNKQLSWDTITFTIVRNIRVACHDVCLAAQGESI